MARSESTLKMRLVAGRKAPLFTGKTFDGQSISLKDYLGRMVALVFYPRDFTPTCTVEVCNLRDHYTSLKNAGIHLIGISADDEQSHQRFAVKNALPFPLIADTQKKIIGKYGVWAEKQLYGKKYMGIIRTTFLIDKEGKILHVFEKVQSARHAEQLLEFLEKEK
jgi:peroxiredoxin Q/BCP